MMKEMVYGPLNKTLHTQSLELLTKLMLHKPSSIRLSIEQASHGSSIIAHFGQHSFNLSHLIKKANLHHIDFNQSDSDQFISQRICIRTQGSKNPEHKHLSDAEQDALSDFGQGSYFHNNFLYNNLSAFEGKHVSQLSAAFLKVMMTSSALNKLAPSAMDKATFRGEKDVRQEDIDTRIEMVQKGGDYTQESAFKSTSIRYDEALRWSKNKCLIQFENHAGKDISGFSFYKSEDEILLNVEKILWTGYKNVDGMHVFTARIVNPLDEVKDTVSNSDLVQFKALASHANKQGFKVDNLTDYNQSLIHQQGQSVLTSFADRLENSDLPELFDENDLSLANLLSGAKDALCCAFELSKSCHAQAQNTLEHNVPVKHKISVC